MTDNSSPTESGRPQQTDLSCLFEDAENALTSVDPPATAWDQDSAKHALDELFSLTHQYRTGKAYHDLLQFIACFRFYSPFNAMLVHVQMPGARFVAPPHRWLRDFGRRIKAGARPLVMLRPMGPVMFVFDVSDTEVDPSLKGRFKPLPIVVESPFDVRKGKLSTQLPKTAENAKRDGVAIHTARLGSQRGGSICAATTPGATLIFAGKIVPVRYELELGQAANDESQYATLVHELAHLYCGHQGTSNDKWWPDRRGLAHDVREFEAESVAYMVCTRLGIDNPSEQYLAGYADRQNDVPPISLECVMKSAGRVEAMGRKKLQPRKEDGT